MTGMVHITTLLFSPTVVLAPLQGTIQGFLPSSFQCVGSCWVISAQCMSVLLKSSSLLTFTISTSLGIYWCPSYFSLQKKKKKKGNNCPADALLSVSDREGERKSWTQFSEFPSFSQQGGLHVVGHSKKHDFHRASGSSQISQQGMNPWPLLRLQSCA